MDIPYHCTNKTYIDKSTQVQDQDLSSKDESGMVAIQNQEMRGWVYQRRPTRECWKAASI